MEEQISQPWKTCLTCGVRYQDSHTCVYYPDLSWNTGFATFEQQVLAELVEIKALLRQIKETKQQEK